MITVGGVGTGSGSSPANSRPTNLASGTGLCDNRTSSGPTRTGDRVSGDDTGLEPRSQLTDGDGDGDGEGGDEPGLPSANRIQRSPSPPKPTLQAGDNIFYWCPTLGPQHWLDSKRIATILSVKRAHVARQAAFVGGVLLTSRHEDQIGQEFVVHIVRPNCPDVHFPCDHSVQHLQVTEDGYRVRNPMRSFDTYFFFGRQCRW